MTAQTFVSYGQNREDVVLRRALRDVTAGSYVDVGANDPRLYSLTRGFYDQGWSGITVEPVPVFAEAHRRERPRDTLVEAAVTDQPIDSVTLHVIGDTGLSTLVDDVSERHRQDGWESRDVAVPARTLDEILESAGWEGRDIHFVSVDVEGAEPEVLRSFDLTRWRPWILVVESTAPRSTEQTHHAWEPRLLEAGYVPCLFDGLSRFYASPDHPELVELLSYPACPLDEFDTDLDRQRREQIDRQQRALEDAEQLVERTRAETVRWRTTALTRWAAAAAPVVTSHVDPAAAARAAHLEQELDATRRTLSWRITAPLRAVRRSARAGR
ncbi:FkbM family methyltransferase [Cellulomonas pakistanensis]|uniref:DNA-binding protein n=1 Tax=Cellulomonas pakistanensis TaxID=992287 RepID=A0A919PD86_9CELL|nr:FkbM family methyltransferase [Cellulomonas pakistanensis]GIG36077.1 DNA-binding protein [Cellulomonas pakistanensis]